MRDIGSTREDEMSITFSIVTSADDSCDLYAVLASEQLTHFLDILRAESDRSNTVLLDGEGDLAAMLSDGFEARVCPVENTGNKRGHGSAGSTG
ncbi:hypothetical protein, partial [Tardiphaga sp.]|uniref:hypothetical protein n=1 Tax=Tardiphaga sp. TaxID=1926292 RepID=UPI003529D533